MSVTDAIRNAVTGYAAYWRYLGFLSLVVGMPILLLAVLLGQAGMTGLVIGAVIAIVAGFWIQGLLVQSVDDLQEGSDELTIAARLSRLRPHLRELTVAAAGLSIALVPASIASLKGRYVLSLILLLVGAVALTFAALSIPLLVIDGMDVGTALRSSFELVSGNLLHVFATLFAVALVTGFVEELLLRLLIKITDSLSIVVIFVHAYRLLVTVPLFALAILSIYYTLREAPPARSAPAAAS